VNKAATAEQVVPQPFRFTREQYYQMAEWGWFEGQKVELLDGVIWNQYGNDDSGEPAPRPFSQQELYRILEAGWFDGHRVELIGGEIVEMPAAKNAHAMAIKLTQDALDHAFGPGFWVRVQMSLDLQPHSTPDPNLAVVAGSVRSHNPGANPTTALLIVEASDTTLFHDRRRKGSLYAASGIADYWIVNLVYDQFEVYRNPVADAQQDFGFRYSQRTILVAGDTVAPLVLPAAVINVADLMP
jgi:Uma2 family endonuclease